MYLPHAIDISVKLFVDFWNRKRAVEDREAIEFLSALLAHPDGDHARSEEHTSELQSQY